MSALPRMLLPKPMRKELPEYLKYIRQQPCLVAKCYRRVEAAHIVFNGQGRLSSKVQDTQTVPLCRTVHHRQYHRIGREAFEREHGLNFYQSIIDFMTDYILRGVE